MTKEEIKKQFSMRNIISRYGFCPTGSGFIPCPFHQGDNDASMKIYEKDYHCFGCGANGDIFTFIQKMDGVSFKEAFLSLGGEYEKPTFSSRLAVYRANKRQEMNALQERKRAIQRSNNNILITVYRKWLGHCEPYSDAWRDCMNALQYQLYILEELNIKKEAR